MDNLTQDEQKVLQDLYQYVVEQLFHLERNSQDVKADLVAKGLDAETADIIIQNVKEQIVKAKKEQASKDILYGALWCIGGIAVTALTYSGGGGRYVVAWGAILFGGIQFFKGLFNS